MTTERLRVAYHEAGHAVMAACCGYVVRSASIVTNNSERGAVVYALPAGESAELLAGDPAAICRSVLVSLAGLAGDSLYIGAVGLSSAPPAWEGHRNDKQEALTALARYRGARDYRAFQLAAVQILSRAGRAELVAELAGSLMAQRLIEGEELSAICGRVPRFDETDVAMLADVLFD